MTYSEIWDVLVEHCQASALGKAEFEGYMLANDDGSRKLEYRFQGILGFGGKVWVEKGETPYVTCYPEDLTDYREVMIVRANAALKKLAGEKEIAEEPLTVIDRRNTGVGQVTKCALGAIVFYIRENLVDGKQVLELAVPEERWKRVSAVVAMEDSMGRGVMRNPEFTMEAAESILKG